MKRITVTTLAATLVAGAALAGCSSSDSGDPNTIKVAYQHYGGFVQAHDHFQRVKADFEAAHPDITVELVPIEATETDYFTKLALMNRSESTAPDVMYQDTFRIKADAEAGYILPLDDYLADWADWEQFYDNAKEAGKGTDGKTYGVSMGTDTRALWYNTELFEQAGLPVPWEPKTWDDVLTAARTVKAELPDVVPFNIYSGKGAGEAASMQGFEMLLYGTDDTLYDDASSTWVTGSQGFVDSLGFVETVFSEGLTPTPQEALDPNLWSTVQQTWIPESKIAIALDGSWVAGNYLEDGATPWPEWSEVMDFATMPTQNGQEPGGTSMSGGWTLAIGSTSKNPDTAWEFIALSLDKDNSTSYDVAAGQLPVRGDVAQDPAFLDSSNPSTPFFASVVEVTHFRPATSDYTEISTQIQVAMEAVMTGQASAEDAAAAYDAAVTKIVGAENTTAG